MEQVKIKNYEREHGPGTFIRFRHLPQAEADALRYKITTRLGLELNTSPLELVKAIQQRSSQFNGLNATDNQFRIRQVLTTLELNISPVTYLNWYRYDDIDEVSTNDLCDYFHDIWYPSADDLDLVDTKVNWILSIEHDGAIRVLRLNNRGESNWGSP
jgi:hypothetical protein